MQVRVHPLAEAEFDSAFGWYAAISTKLARDFSDAFEATLAHIEFMPEAFPLIDETHRWHSFKKFPYGLVYRIEADEILVVAVPRNGQQTGYWAGR